MPSEELMQLVAEDVTEGLKKMFEPREGFSPRDSFEGGIGDDTLAAVPWTYGCAHTGNSQNMFPTGRTVRIEGLTIIDRRGARPAFIRYVDWSGVFGQLGMTVSPRVLVTEEEYEFGLERFREFQNEDDPED